MFLCARVIAVTLPIPSLGVFLGKTFQQTGAARDTTPKVPCVTSDSGGINGMKIIKPIRKFIAHWPPGTVSLSTVDLFLSPDPFGQECTQKGTTPLCNGVRSRESLGVGVNEATEMSLAGMLGAGRSTEAISLSETVTEDTSRAVEIDSVFKVS